MTVISMDFPQNMSDHMPEKSDPIAHNGKQNVLVYHTRQNLLKFPQGVVIIMSARKTFLVMMIKIIQCSFK